MLESKMLKLKKNKRFEIIHPCIDNLNGELRLKIFRYMFGEPLLPKFSKGQIKSDEDLDKDSQWMINHMSKSASEFTDESDRSIVRFKEALAMRAKHKYTWWERLKRKLFHKEVDVEEMMNSVKDKIYNLNDKTEPLSEEMTKLILRAKLNSQVALVDKLMEYKNVVEGQIKLAKNGFDKYVTEQSVIEFIKKSHRGVRIDFIRNFAQLIPFAVQDKKIEADKLEVFDNYCILYYDPNWESFGEAEVRVEQEYKEYKEAKKREMERWKKDPILFGMIKGSRNLYFVADWITSDDDLTLEKLNLIVENATQYINEFEHDTEENWKISLQSLSDAIKNKEFEPV